VSEGNPEGEKDWFSLNELNEEMKKILENVTLKRQEKG